MRRDRCMRSTGGIYGHVGFGFHRYSTDEEWRVPHFEKMLYDQALLSMTYLEAFQATGKARYGETAREILAYVCRGNACKTPTTDIRRMLKQLEQ